MPMTPLQSWATMILLIVFAVALTHLVVRGDARLTAALAAPARSGEPPAPRRWSGPSPATPPGRG